MSGEESEEELHPIDWTTTDPFFDYEDPFSMSPQHSAVLGNDVPRLRRLIESGKSANINDNLGNTPLHTAVLKDKNKVFDYLLTLDEVRLDAQNHEGNTPLHLAVICANIEFALALIAKGADVNATCLSGYAPLHYAVSHNVPVALRLLQEGADLNARNSLGATPLFMACQRGHQGAIHMLLYHGADATMPNNDEILPLALALTTCPRSLQEILFNYTFDRDKVPVDLRMLTLAMRARSPLFRKIVEKTSRVEYDEEDLRRLNRTLPYIDPKLFKIFLKKFEDVAEAMFSTCSSLMDYIIFLNTEINEKPDVLGFFYAVCESPLVAVAVANYEPKLRLLDSIIGRDLDEQALTKIVCCLMSFGIDIISDDLDTVYKRYGYNELFKIMLHMDFVDCSVLYKRPRLFRMPAVIYDVELDLEQCLDQPEKFICFSGIEGLKRHFALYRYREFIHNSIANYSDKVENVVMMPTLVELARNAARKQIIQKYKIRKCFHFYTVLKWLPIADVYKAILSFEKKLYKL